MWPLHGAQTSTQHGAVSRGQMLKEKESEGSSIFFMILPEKSHSIISITMYVLRQLQSSTEFERDKIHSASSWDSNTVLEVLIGPGILLNTFLDYLILHTYHLPRDDSILLLLFNIQTISKSSLIQWDLTFFVRHLSWKHPQIQDI